MGKGAPSPPDPYATAQAQSNANFLNAQQNFGFQNVNEYTPYGNKTYEQSGWYDVINPMTGQHSQTPQYSSHVTLSPAEQEILNKNTAMRSNIGTIGQEQSARLQQHLNKPLDMTGMQAWNAGPNAPKLATAYGGNAPVQMGIAGQGLRQDQGPTDRMAIEQAMMDRYERQAAPRNAAQEAEMAARGMSPGGQGYGDMRDIQGRERAEAGTNAYLASGGESRAAQDAYNQAAMQRFGQSATQGAFANSAQQQAYQQAAERAGFGNAAQAQMFGMGGQAATLQNQLRQSQMQEMFAMRNQPINEIMALLGGAGVNTPQFQPFQGSSMQAPNIGQYIYDNYNARAQNSANQTSGMFGLGSAVMGALPLLMGTSDRRLKQDIEPLGKKLAGVPLYWFRYKADPRLPDIGVMADEAKLLHPDAVHEIDGYDHVDYALLHRRHSG